MIPTGGWEVGRELSHDALDKYYLPVVPRAWAVSKNATIAHIF